VSQIEYSDTNRNIQVFIYTLYIRLFSFTHIGMKIFAYSYRKDPVALRNAGATVIFVDTSPDRTERANMMHRLGLRRGDTLLLYSLRDLGGSPAGDAKWRQMVEDRGVSIEIVKVENQPKKVGPKAKYRPGVDGAKMDRAVWLDETRSERDRLKAISARNGHEVTRGMVIGRYGWPSRPKPFDPDDFK